MTTGQGTTKGQPSQGPKKSFKARLLELFDEIDSDEPAPPAAGLNVNSVSIIETVSSGLAVTGAAVQVDGAQSGSSRQNNQPQWARSQQFEVDFPKGL